MLKLSVFLLAALFSRPAVALRTMVLPPLEVAAYHDFLQTAWGGPTNFKAGKPLLAGLLYVISLENTSNVTQTGTLEFSLGTYAIANQCCPTFYLRRTLALCSNTDGSFAQVTGLPRQITWSVGPKSPVELRAIALFDGNLNPGLLDQVAIRFKASLNLTVKEDRGAVVGTVVTVSSLVSAYQTCTHGQSVTLAGSYGNYLNREGVGQIVPINGGRAF
jgi:hypothetical protein